MIQVVILSVIGTWEMMRLNFSFTRIRLLYGTKNRKNNMIGGAIVSDFDWKSLLGGIAPTIATALGGPFAGTAVKFLSNKLLGKDEAEEAEIAMALQTASPEVLAEIKKLDYEFKTTMRKLGIKEQELAYQDTANARDMAKNTSLVPQIVLSAVFISGYFTVLIMKGLHADAFEVDPMTFGIITVSIPVIMQFWFGSSAGSKSKDNKNAS